MIRDLLPAHGGREVKTTGDGFLLEFPSALAAVRAGVEIQRVLHERNAREDTARQVRVRIGIHVGDVVVQDGDIHGDGVNIAARLEPLALPGGICVSEDVERQVRNKLSQSFVALGPAELKNIVLPVSVHRVLLPWQPAATPAPSTVRFRMAPSGLKWIALAASLLLAFGLSLWQPWRRGSPAAAAAAVPPAPKEASAPTASPLQRVKEILAKGSDASRDDLRLAITLSQSVVDKNPENDEAWSLLSLATSNLYENYDRSPERFSAAQSAANSAVNLAPQSVTAKVARARVLTLKPATNAEGVRQLRELANANPRDPAVLAALGQSLQDWDAYGAESLEIFDRLLKLRPNDPVGLNGKALSLNYLGRNAEAAAFWEDSIRRTGSPTSLLYRFYDLWSLRGEDAEAMRLAAQFPADFVYNDMAVRLVGNFWLSQREPARALAFVDPFPRDFIEDLFVEFPKGYLTGKAHAMAGRPEAAKLAWRRALAAVDRQLAVDPEKRNALEYKSRLHLLLGEEAESGRALEQMRQLGGRELSLGLAWELGREADVVAIVERQFRSAMAEKPSAQPPRATLLLNLRSLLRRAPNLYPGMATPPRVQEILAAIDAELAASTDGKIASGSIPAKSVAVLAFANLSDDKQNEYFSDGISEELLNVLAKVPGLKVSARTSAFHFKGKDTPIPEIAKQLGVAYVVEGSVRKAGNLVRITAQLINAADGFHVWSDSFDREVKDTFALQDEIAGLIAKNLQLKLGDSVAARPVDPEAFRLYLEGREAWNRRTDEGLDEAEKLVGRAIEKDPQFARALAAMADVWAIRAVFAQDTGQSSDPFQDAARSWATKALAADPNLAEPYATRGILLARAGELAAAESVFRQALALNPNYASAHQWYGKMLVENGEIERGLQELELARQLDPLSPIIAANSAGALLMARRYGEALVLFDRVEALGHGDFGGEDMRPRALFRLGRRDEAIAGIRRNLRNSHFWDNLSQRGDLAILAQVGEKQEAADRLALELTNHPLRREVTAEIYMALGRRDEAIALLTREKIKTDALWSLLDPVWDPIRNEPDFLGAVEKSGYETAYRRAWTQIQALQKTK